jgi:oligosaccharide reducing-end xylanase
VVGERGPGARPARRCATLLLLLWLPACGRTVDSLGYNGAANTPLKHLTGPASYPNAFRDLLGKSDADIAAKIAAAFAQLFHGDPLTQSVYVPVGTDQAYILDVLHGDIRTEGIALGMLIAVELAKRDEFDRLWTYAKSVLQIKTGPSQGYFPSFCDTETDTATVPCLDPFGLQQFLMSLLFAYDRWGGAGDAGAPSTIDYAADAQALIAVIRNKQDDNHGVVDGVTNTFDATSRLVFDVPDVSSAGVGRPSIEMPAYYDLFAQATGDPFWPKAAAAGRAYWKRSANATTGFMPIRADFDGTPVIGSDSYSPEAYRVQLDMALDRIWSGGDAWESDEADRLLQFFLGQGIDRYGSRFTLDGGVVDATRESSLIALNGVSGLIATNPQRSAFIDAVWNAALPTDGGRYFGGIFDLLALLVLGGQLQVY